MAQIDVLKPKDIITLREFGRRIIPLSMPSPYGPDKMRQKIQIRRPGFRHVLAIFEYDVENCVVCGNVMEILVEPMNGNTHGCINCGRKSLPMCSVV